MDRIASALAASLAPSHVGREMIEAGSQVGAEAASARIVSREHLAVEQPGEELLDHILGVGRLELPLEPQPAVGGTPVETDQGVDRHPTLGGVVPTGRRHQGMTGRRIGGESRVGRRSHAPKVQAPSRVRQSDRPRRVSRLLRWYLGEDSKEIEDGHVVGTEGSWEWGVESNSTEFKYYCDGVGTVLETDGSGAQRDELPGVTGP